MGAVNIPVVMLRDDDFKLLPEDRLRKLFESMGATPEKTIVTYCSSGIQASVGALAAEEAGFTNVRLYDASFSEFGSLEETKPFIETSLMRLD